MRNEARKDMLISGSAISHKQKLGKTVSMYAIKSYSMKLAAPDCFPGADWYRAVIDLNDDITEVLPYLNAELEGAVYTHDSKVLLWNNGKNKYAFRPNEIVVAPADNSEEAVKLATDIVGQVNNIWIRKEEIEPSFDSKKALPNILDIYKLLPRTNCSECGSPSCMAFAAVLRNDSSKISLCPYISDHDYSSLMS